VVTLSRAELAAGAVVAVATKAGVGVEQLISVDPVFTAPDNTGPAPAPQSSAAATPHPPQAPQPLAVYRLLGMPRAGRTQPT
jgi:hypothetical protein